MNAFLVFIISVPLIYVFMSWILPRLCSYFLEKVFKISIRVGRLKFPSFKLCDTQISLQGFHIQINEISIKSSFINSELTKLVTLVIKDVRINKDIGKQNEIYEDNVFGGPNLDFRQIEVPKIINTFAQFMALHIYSISAMLLNLDTPGCLIHATASELHLDGSILKNAKSLLVTLNLKDATAKVLRHAKDKRKETCLAEFSFIFAMEAILVAQGPLSVESLEVRISQTSAIVSDGFYNIIQNKRKFEPKNNQNSNVIEKILPIIPKNCLIQIQDTSLKGIKENGHIQFRSCLKSLYLNYRSVVFQEKLHEDETNFVFSTSELLLQNRKEQLLNLKSLKIDAKLKNNNVNVYLILNNFTINYIHSEIYQWIFDNFLKNVSHSQNKLENSKSEAKNQILGNSFLDDLMKNLTVNFCSEFHQVSLSFLLNGHGSSIGFNHARFMLDQSQRERDSLYKKYYANLLFKNRQWQMEFLLESFWWSFKEWSHNTNISKSMHIWGTPMYLEVCLIKIESNQNNGINLRSFLDIVQLEWSLELADYVLLAIRCVKQYGNFASIKKPHDKNVDLLKNTKLDLALTHFNFFLQSNNSEYFVSRLNSIDISMDSQSTKINFKEFKMFTLVNTGSYICIRSEDSSNYKVYFQNTQVEIKNTTSSIRINISESIQVFWSTNFHFKTFLLLKDITEFLTALKEEFGSMFLTSMGKKKKTDFDIVGYIDFRVHISESHDARFIIGRTRIVYQKDTGLIVQNDLTNIEIDTVQIFEIKGLHLKRIVDSELVKQERFDNELFELEWNKTWGLTIDLFKAIFPYVHGFAEAIHSEFLSILKWLRMLHDLKKNKFTTRDSPLPSDLVINLKEFLFEMSDDPFEVKLRDNFMLLEDEYYESLKRQKVLKEKITELSKTHLHLPAGKGKELYAKLRQKNAEIYVQRSKQLQNSAPKRTRLFAWSMTNVEILALADPSIHGTKNVIKIMRNIDHETPWPEEGIDFSTLWCRLFSLRCKEWKFLLRDFPQPLLDISQCYISGPLIGAEQVAPNRAIRNVLVDLGEPFDPFCVERGMLPLKYYHDFNCEIESFSYAFGPCWEPVIAQCNLSFEKIFPPSQDPSPPLPFWDKMRLILHGRLTMVVNRLRLLLHASLDPYNTTEEMECTWSKVIMDWTNAKYIYKGDLNIFVRTASKYDDCQLLHLPNLKLILGIKWNCLSNPNDHHNVYRCAPNKIPEYSSNQVHDSFRAFRSQSVNLSIAMETKPLSNQSPTNNFDNPTLVLYGSTLRWIENLKLILSGVTRPTKRGVIFKNVRPRKIQLSRHYKKLHLTMVLHRFQICYWMSYAMQRGCELLGVRLSSSSEHTLSLVSIDDGLIHRPRAEWSIMYMTSDLNDSELWLKSALQDDSDCSKEEVACGHPVEKFYCLSVAKVSYGRETVLPCLDNDDNIKDTPSHRLVVYDLKGAWTKSNRNVALALFDTFMRSKRMKKNLSTDALKGFRKENTTPKRRKTIEASTTPPNSQIQTSYDPIMQLSKLQSGPANMLQQLIAEAEKNAVVYSDDLSAAPKKQQLQGLQACHTDDVQHTNWQISLVNAQVLLKGCESKGYVIISAAKAEITQRIHRPAWKNRTLVSKTTWTGLLECMQYYATVNAGENDDAESIMWLSVDNIQEKESTEISEPSEVPNMVGSGVSVGAVVSDTVGLTTSSQLQRIVSRCKCEFFYANYGDISVDPQAIGELPPPPQEEVGPWDRPQEAVDAFTLMHHDLEVCTNSLQYAVLLDVVNNLLLYVEPHRKEASERLARMRFQLQLHTVDDQRRPIQNQQTLVRNTVSKLRRLEKETYLVSKALAENGEDSELLKDMNKLLQGMYECKTQLNSYSDELDLMLSCYKEGQLLANSRLATTRSDKPLAMARAYEICFKHAQWRLTEADGQIGIADLVLSNFLYTKNSKSDDSVEHLLELGYLRMNNLLPNEIYNEVICPTELLLSMPLEHKKVLRIFCRERPPVGGISVKEHFEINVVPLTIGLTKKFFHTMMKFCFPEREPDNTEYDKPPEEEDHKIKKKIGRKNRDSNFYIHIDDVEKMKERAEKNKLFVYIKIPEVPVRVSYKGTKEKNFEDLRDVSILIPTLEYHNMTWTWLDFLMGIRNDTKRVILSQAIKQKLAIKRSNLMLSDESSTPHEDDKAKMLFGDRHAVENKSIRKGVSGVFKFGNK